MTPGPCPQPKWVALARPEYPAGYIPADGGQPIALGHGACPCAGPPYVAAASVDCAALHYTVRIEHPAAAAGSPRVLGFATLLAGLPHMPK